MASALEVLVELAPHAVDLPRGAEHAAAGQLREPFEVLLDVRVEGDAEDPAVAGGDEQLPDGALHEVVARVEQAATGCCVAEAAVEIGRDGHGRASLRSRRTPVEAAWRAASGLESSTAAIWS